jgi:hypothetical protein
MQNKDKLIWEDSNYWSKNSTSEYIQPRIVSVKELLEKDLINK